jgi:hypothetical protein
VKGLNHEVHVLHGIVIGGWFFDCGALQVEGSAAGGKLGHQPLLVMLSVGVDSATQAAAAPSAK